MDVKTLINTRVQELFNLSIKDCSNEQAYIALLSVVKDLLDDKRQLKVTVRFIISLLNS